MSTNHTDKLEQYERRAAGVRKIAGKLPDPDSKLLRNVAKQYMRMAKWLSRTGQANLNMVDTGARSRDLGGEG
jgi:hypothetical protein